MMLFPSFKKKKTKRKLKKVEEPHQVSFVKWFRMQYPQYSKLLTISSIGENVGAARMERLKQMGLTPGWPDLFLAVPVSMRQEVVVPGARPKVIHVDRWSHGLGIELKQPKIVGKNTPRASSSQKDVLKLLEEKGYSTKICFGWEEARDAVQGYLNEKNNKENS